MQPLPDPIKDNQNYEGQIFGSEVPLKKQATALLGSTKFKITTIVLVLAAIGGYFLSLFLSH